MFASDAMNRINYRDVKSESRDANICMQTKEHKRDGEDGSNQIASVKRTTDFPASVSSRHRLCLSISRVHSKFTDLSSRALALLLLSISQLLSGGGENCVSLLRLLISFPSICLPSVIIITRFTHTPCFVRCCGRKQQSFVSVRTTVTSTD